MEDRNATAVVDGHLWLQVGGGGEMTPIISDSGGGS